MGQSFLVMSGKGGVGKTTTAVNLGASLAARGYKVALLDANLLTPNLGFHFKVPENVRPLNDLLAGKASLFECTHFFSENLWVIPSSFTVQSLRGAHADRLRGILEQLSELRDAVLVDAGPGLGDEVMQAMKTCSSSLIVTNPEIAAVADAAKTVHVADSLSLPVHGIVLNRTGRFQEELSKEKVEEVIGRPLLGTIPEDQRVPRAFHKGVPLHHLHPLSPAARSFGKLSAVLSGEQHRESLSLLDRLKIWLGFY